MKRSNPGDEFTAPVRRMMNDFVHNHPGLKVSADIRARIDRIAKSQLPATWGGYEGRTWGDLEKRTEKALEAVESLPEPQRSDQVDYTLKTYNKLVKMEKSQKWWAIGGLIVGAILGFFGDGLAGMVF